MLAVKIHHDALHHPSVALSLDTFSFYSQSSRRTSQSHSQNEIPSGIFQLNILLIEHF